jgi:hypothetical protein
MIWGTEVTLVFSHPFRGRLVMIMSRGLSRAALQAIFVHACLLAAPAHSQGSTSGALTDSQIREHIIRDSISSYSRSCPCPYNSARNGGRCGVRSAYSRRDGQAPLCYPEDISDDMVRRYRRQTR